MIVEDGDRGHCWLKGVLGSSWVWLGTSSRIREYSGRIGRVGGNQGRGVYV